MFFVKILSKELKFTFSIFKLKKDKTFSALFGIIGNNIIVDQIITFEIRNKTRLMQRKIGQKN